MSHFLLETLEEVPEYDRADVVIVPVPYEATTTYRQGCQNGPEALLTASRQVEYFDSELWLQPCDRVGIYTCDPVCDTRKNPHLSGEEMVSQVAAVTSKIVADGKFAIAIGGEHSITEGVVKGFSLANPNERFTVVQIDAHGDLRYEYEGSIYNHACVMRRIVDMGLPTVQIGIRSICQEESDFIKERNLKIVWDRDIATRSNWIETTLAAIPTDRVFITIDLDGINPGIMPGVGTPEPGGLGWYDLLAFLRRLCETHTVIGGDVMELAPVADSVVSEFTAAKLVYKLIAYAKVLGIRD